MSNAKKCDRCGAFYVICTRDYIVMERNLADVIDLCPDCHQKLKSWIHRNEEAADDEH